MKNLIFIVTFIFSSIYIHSQELNCKVIVNSDKVPEVQKSIFNTLQKSITEFVNNRKWSEMTFANTERIECTFSLFINKFDNESFTAEIQIQSRRPVYNSTYFSPLINFRDNSFVFNYKESDQIEFNQSNITSNLSAVLAYYSYMVLGFDMDSYSNLGGSSFFQSAESIVNAAQGGSLGPGWDVSFKNSNNRYALINNIMDEAFKKFRVFFYEYHRYGLDGMSENVVNARARISDGMPLIREANRARPLSILITSFLQAKDDELINIFSKATPKEKTDVVQILTDVNPTQATRYEKILK